jgi:hypothetical protein
MLDFHLRLESDSELNSLTIPLTLCGKKFFTI